MKLNQKDLYEFLRGYLPKDVPYHRSFDFDEEIEDVSIGQSGDKEYTMTVRLTTGKGYSSHWHERTYTFVRQGYTYRCDRQLYDKDKEAQIVRKLKKGLEEFMGDQGHCMQTLAIKIEQELD